MASTDSRGSSDTEESLALSGEPQLTAKRRNAQAAINGGRLELIERMLALLKFVDQIERYGGVLACSLGVV